MKTLIFMLSVLGKEAYYPTQDKINYFSRRPS